MRCALDVVLLLRLRIFHQERRRWHDLSYLIMLAGSLWLMFLQARSTRRSQLLLDLIGRDPWLLGWEALWQTPCVYLVFPFPVRTALHGLLFYVGETVCFRRRFLEHVLRLLDPAGFTQQPFYRYVRHGCESNEQLLAALCFLMMVPVRSAPADRGARLVIEKSLTRVVGNLNPPHVYSLPPFTNPKKRRVRALRIFEGTRPVRRLRDRATGKQSLRADPVSMTSSPQIVRKAWREGLLKTAAALAGHRFPHCDAASLAAWNLSPGAWAFVARRIDQYEEGWRRRRGLRLLKLISGRRPDLARPISLIQATIPWPGSENARRIICQGFRSLLRAWRRQGVFVPVLRHAKCNVSWAAGTTLAEALSTAASLEKLLVGGRAPSCSCSQLLLQDPTWTAVTCDGQEHIAASQGSVPWPDSLQHLARWPASITLAPRWEDIASSVRSAFRRLRNRCRIPPSCRLADIEASQCTEHLWNVFQASQNGAVPVSWTDVASARTWLTSNNFLVSKFDHNTSCLAVICPRMAFLHACKLLDFGPCASEDANILWQEFGHGQQESILRTLAQVPGLPSELAPLSVSRVPKSTLGIGSTCVLPKWKAPGLKWRLIIRKHRTPCGALHSLVSRAIDVLLDNFPTHLWSDYLSMAAVMPLVADFNMRSAAMGCDVGCTAAADMVDCFRHLPCDQAPVMWDSLAAFWSDKGISCVSVAAKQLACRGRLGFCEDPGWYPFRFDSIRTVLAHFSNTNFIALGPYLGREQVGAPQGDALSSAVLRLWKWHREFVCRTATHPAVLALPDSKCKLVHLISGNLLVLDVSYRDDLRMFLAWKSQSGLTREFVFSWAWQQFTARFCTGTMCLEESDPDFFTGLSTIWAGTSLCLRPRMPDPWAAHCYDELDNFPLKPWPAWAPAKQHYATLRGLLSRAWYFCSTRNARLDALWEIFVTLVFRACFPWPVVRSRSLAWAREWTPKGRCTPDPELLSDVTLALCRFEETMA